MRYPKKNTAAQKTAHTMRRVSLILIVVLFLGSISGYSILAIKKPLSAINPAEYSLDKNTIEKDITLAWPPTGQASIGSIEQGVLVNTSNQTPTPIASTAKVITALAVLSKKPFRVGSQGETLTLGSRDVDLYNYYVRENGSNVPVVEGELITEYQALEAVLLPSANNIADSLAIWAFGSIEAYIIYTNDMLAHLSATRTVVADASGFSDLTVSTAHDLVLIGQKALQNPVLKQIVSEKQAEIPVANTIYNVNRLLGQENIIGIKTGNTVEAGGCLLFAATHAIDSEHSITIIGAVTGAADLSTVFESSLALLKSAGSHFKVITVLPIKSKVGFYKTAWGEKSEIYSTAPLMAYGWTGKSYDISLNLKYIYAPLKKDTYVGSIVIRSDDYLSSTTAVTATTLQPPSMLWRLKHYF